MEEHQLVELVTIVIGLLFAAALTAMLTKALRFPYTVGLLVLGIALAFAATKVTFLEPLQHVRLTPGIILFVLIPTLIFEAAINIDVKLLFKHLPIILKLAFTGVLLSTLIVAVIVNLTTPLSLGHAVLFGALISATDPVAVIALFKELGASERLTTLVDGESLFNDATAIVLFGIILLVIQSGEPFSMAYVGTGLVQFLGVFFGGILVGGVLSGLCFLIIWRQQTSALIQIALSTVLAYIAFIVAEHLHVSGIMAVLAAGLVGTWLAERALSEEMRHYLHHYWEYAAFVANSFIFLLLGFHQEGLMVDMAHYREQTIYLVWAIIAVIVARAVVIYGIIPINNKVFKDDPIDTQHQTILFWGGLRGAIPLALVLSLPPDFEHRLLLLDLTLGVVLFTLLIQGTTIKFLLRKFALSKN